MATPMTCRRFINRVHFVTFITKFGHDFVVMMNKYSFLCQFYELYNKFKICYVFFIGKGGPSCKCSDFDSTMVERQPSSSSSSSSSIVIFSAPVTKLKIEHRCITAVCLIK